jgi:hypothetical protein
MALGVGSVIASNIRLIIEYQRMHTAGMYDELEKEWSCIVKHHRDESQKAIHAALNHESVRETA